MTNPAADHLLDRVAIVTGAASGIGRRTAQRFAAAGARVVVADVNTAGATRVAAELSGAFAVTVDISEPESVRSMISDVTTQYGRIDIMINNAMICGRSSFLDAGVDEIRRDFAVNILGPYLCCQQVIPSMIDNGGGVIINLSSVNGVAHLGNTAYSVAKAGVLQLTRSIAVEFGDRGVRCNAVVPGTVRTEVWDHRIANDPHALDAAAQWYPLGRVGEPDDVADACVFLASDRASWITGAALPVDGGLLAGNLAMAKGITAGD